MSTASDNARSPTPNGCVVGLAEEIVQAIGSCEYGPKKNRFALLVWSSFKQAGRQNGDDAGLRYFFDLQNVCQRLNISKTTAAHIRSDLVRDGLFTYTPNQNDYGTGWLVWKTNYRAWLPLQSGAHHWGGNRKQSSIADLTTEDASSEQRLIVITPSSEQRLPAITPIKRAMVASFDAAPQQAAIVELKKGTEEEEYEEETYSASLEHASIAPLAHTAGAVQGDTYSALRKREDAEREQLKARITTLQSQIAQERDHRTLKDLRLRLHLSEQNLRELSDSRTQPAPIVTEQQESLARAWLSEQQHIKIETRSPDPVTISPVLQLVSSGDPGDETWKALRESEDTYLFAEAVPPAKVSFEKEVGSWFFDWEHVSERNRTRVNIALGKLKKQGYTSLEQLRAAYESWRFLYRDLERKSVMHFADHAGALPQC